MGGTAASSASISKLLDIAKANHDIPPAVTQRLERTNTEVWQKIQAHPSTYVMNKDEYAVLNYYQERYKNSRQYDQAIARFWKHFKGNPSEVNGPQASSHR